MQALKPPVILVMRSAARLKASTMQALKPGTRIMFLAVSAESPSIPGFGLASLLKESPDACF
jgi:hypothetical protein